MWCFKLVKGMGGVGLLAVLGACLMGATSGRCLWGFIYRHDRSCSTSDALHSAIYAKFDLL